MTKRDARHRVASDHHQTAAFVKEVFGALLPEVEQRIAVSTTVRSAPGVTQIEKVSVRQASVQLAQHGEAAKARIVYADHLEARSPGGMSSKHSADRPVVASRAHLRHRSERQGGTLGS